MVEGLLPSCRWGTSCLAIGSQCLKAVFCCILPVCWAEQKVSGSLKAWDAVHRLPQLLPLKQPGEQMGRDEGSPGSLSGTLCCTYQPGHPGHPAPRSPIPGSHSSAFWKHCVWQLSKWNTARLLLRKNVVFGDFPRNSWRKEFGSVTYGVHETPACCPSPPQDLCSSPEHLGTAVPKIC